MPGKSSTTGFGNKNRSSSHTKKALVQPQPTWGGTTCLRARDSESIVSPEGTRASQHHQVRRLHESRVCGWKTTDSRAAWRGSRTTSWSSSSFLSILRKGQGLVSSTCWSAQCMIGPTSGERSSGTSRAPTSALGALGTTSTGYPKKETNNPIPPMLMW
jgi:hypothetical protein